MELELGLKITHTREDITSFTDLRISKDHSGPLFVSRETNSKFILIAYLKGFRRENVSIKINGEGNQMEISGEKPVQEMVMMGLIMYKKDVELRTFRKVFRIPDAVVLDRIRAKFNDDEAVLTIFIPKSEKGIRGVSIEEVKDEFEAGGSSSPEESRKIPDAELPGNDETGQVPEEEGDGRGPELVNPKAEELPSRKDSMESLKEEQQEDQGQVKEKVVETIQKQGSQEESASSKAIPDSKKEEETMMEEQLDREEPLESKEEIVGRKPEKSEMAESEKTDNEIRDKGVPESKPESKKDEARMEETWPQEHESEKQEPETETTAANSVGEGKRVESSDKSNVEDVSKRSKMCRPAVIAGSSILVSIIVIVIGFIRSRRKKVVSRC
ncbi:unnamed protein product [Linum trigynum]|uniref:SHSP domain-containing protein n=1 Tax=Linum trigynum TaxID=586398 RepID=A0AAV2D113_9ROSI